jgi:hypothetical protein
VPVTQAFATESQTVEACRGDQAAILPFDRPRVVRKNFVACLEDVRGAFGCSPMGTAGTASLAAVAASLVVCPHRVC